MVPVAQVEIEGAAASWKSNSTYWFFFYLTKRIYY
jgi:hypothetical protein